MTTVLGFRADPSAARYAIVEDNGQGISLRNAATESRLSYPADVTEPSSKVLWLYREIERIFHAHPAIERVVIKTNEYVGRENKAKRTSSYTEAAVLLFCEQKQIPVEIKTYASLGTSSGDVKGHAEQRAGRTSKYWDSKIADAIVAAVWGARQP